jgi:ribonuclease BN (tRNA processing enzyme)
VAKGRNKAVAYTGDTGPTCRFWKNVAAGRVEHLIVETSFPNRLEELALASGHLTPSLLEREIAKMPRAPGNVYVMHLKAQFLAEIEAELRALECADIAILKDGDAIRI